MMAVPESEEVGFKHIGLSGSDYDASLPIKKRRFPVIQPPPFPSKDISPDGNLTKTEQLCPPKGLSLFHTNEDLMKSERPSLSVTIVSSSSEITIQNDIGITGVKFQEPSLGGRACFHSYVEREHKSLITEKHTVHALTEIRVGLELSSTNLNSDLLAANNEEEIDVKVEYGGCASDDRRVQLPVVHADTIVSTCRCLTEMVITDVPSGNLTPSDQGDHLHLSLSSSNLRGMQFDDLNGALKVVKPEPFAEGSKLEFRSDKDNGLGLSDGAAMKHELDDQYSLEIPNTKLPQDKCVCSGRLVNSETMDVCKRGFRFQRFQLFGYKLSVVEDENQNIPQQHPLKVVNEQYASLQGGEGSSVSNEEKISISAYSLEDSYSSEYESDGKRDVNEAMNALDNDIEEDYEDGECDAENVKPVDFVQNDDLALPNVKSLNNDDATNDSSQPAEIASCAGQRSRQILDDETPLCDIPSRRRSPDIREGRRRCIREPGSKLVGLRHGETSTRTFEDETMDPIYAHPQPPFEVDRPPFIQDQRNFPIQSKSFPRVDSRSPGRFRGRPPGQWFPSKRKSDRFFGHSEMACRSPTGYGMRSPYQSPPIDRDLPIQRRGFLVSPLPWRFEDMDPQDRIEGGEYFDGSVEPTCDGNGDDRRRFHERYEHQRHEHRYPLQPQCNNPDVFLSPSSIWVNAIVDLGFSCYCLDSIVSFSRYRQTYKRVLDLRFEFESDSWEVSENLVLE
ncbi:hypothetical protein SDJN03_07584, partial [Cucurbita argyrosperma subsp. sororia]